MPVFSEITIDFLVDFEEDYTLGMTFDDNSVLSSQLFTWVTTRGTTGEVTTGTPTATPGETTAINFEAAFDLDNLTNFITTRTVNSLLIQSEVEGFDFIGIRGLDENGTGLTLGVDFDITFTNFVPPIDNSNIDFALVRSPHYVNIPFNFDTTTSASIDLFVWDGDLATLPLTPTYSLTFPRPATNYTEFNVDLSKLIQEQIDAIPTIDFTLPSQVIDSTADSVKWVHYTASYTDPTEVIADIEGTFAAVDGYGLYNEGVNPTKPANNILTTVEIRKVSRDGFILFPFVNNGTITSIEVNSKTGQINETETITASNESTDIVQYIEVDASVVTIDPFITITTLPATDIFQYELIDECRYNPIQVVFKNRYGVYDCLTLFKKSETEIRVQSDTFVNNYVNAGTYDTTRHQYQKLNVTSKETLKVNSGYVSETSNELFKQLIHSDKVWIYDGALVPVTVKNSSLQFKTRVNNKLINYSIEFEYAYDVIQDV